MENRCNLNTIKVLIYNVYSYLCYIYTYTYVYVDIFYSYIIR